MRLTRAAIAAVLLVLVTGCGESHGPAVVAATSDPCPPPDAAGNAAIDWSEFVRVDGLMFQKTFSPASTMRESQLGATVRTVACRIGGSVGNPDFRARDGDAAYLDAGTELRAIEGYRRDFRLAAWEDGVWHVYEVDDVPDAGTGEDLLDLRDKVSRVHLVEGDRGETILKTVDDTSQVASIVQAVLAAPVLPDTASLYEGREGELLVCVRFDMRDGTAVQREWQVVAGVLSRRIEAPPELEKALSPPRP